MYRPRVSIGMPVYNGQRYLEIALQSLVSQTYADFELIISDNASTDRTAEICQDIAAGDSRVKYVRNEKNVGANPNFNRVLELSRGEYFRWAAYDDICQPQYIARCVEMLDADRGAVLAHTQTTVIDEAGQPIATNPAALAERGIQPHEIDDPPRNLAAPSPVRRFHHLLLKTHWCFEIFGLMRRELLMQTGGHGDFYGSDKVILAYMILQGRFVECPEPLFLRRHHMAQSSAIKTAAQRQVWSGAKKPTVVLGSQKSCFRGYRHAVKKADLTAMQRVGCYGVIARYLTQARKWAKLIGLAKDRNVNLSQMPAEHLLTSK